MSDRVTPEYEYEDYDEYADDEVKEPDNEQYELQEYQFADFVYRDLERIGGDDIDGSGRNIDPISRFKLQVKSLLRDINTKSDININSDIILNKIDSLTFIAHKNPLLYVLGYMYSNEKTPLKIYSIINKFLQEDGIYTIADVIRYANHWEEHLLKLK